MVYYGTRSTSCYYGTQLASPGSKEQVKSEQPDGFPSNTLP